jgi:hypothetical protein
MRNSGKLLDCRHYGQTIDQVRKDHTSVFIKYLPVYNLAQVFEINSSPLRYELGAKNAY